jgi:hypothetical protein
MPNRSKSDRALYARGRRATDLYIHWQAMRRHPDYPYAVQHCLRDIGKQREQWKEKMARLFPHPPSVPEGIPPCLEHFEGSAGDFLFDHWTSEEPPPPTGQACMKAFRDVRNYLDRRKHWEDAHNECSSIIEACSLVLGTAAQLDHLLATEVHRMPYDGLEGNMGVSPAGLGYGLYEALAACCRRLEVRELVSPLLYFTYEDAHPLVL